MYLLLDGLSLAGSNKSLTSGVLGDFLFFAVPIHKSDSKSDA